ncbi:hypothetical protein IE81DRAFT_338880 [Ceraceosorus guamensis]|uniref:Uncharacterized protein n=1 Tax=Ceraceosorus guamensis TaxID=1522189 RepID=A0A316WAI4_9BASI|nr:hypothetical protein IE81DRAFT_338880 [Ceraceosorus guamensis]PWN46028.1 hypothetical protein IE81DRAFT_338880 [Ceraceosorus guamensis]
MPLKSVFPLVTHAGEQGLWDEGPSCTGWERTAGKIRRTVDAGPGQTSRHCDRGQDEDERLLAPCEPENDEARGPTQLPLRWRRARGTAKAEAATVKAKAAAEEKGRPRTKEKALAAKGVAKAKAEAAGGAAKAKHGAHRPGLVALATLINVAETRATLTKGKTAGGEKSDRGRNEGEGAEGDLARRVDVGDDGLGEWGPGDLVGVCVGSAKHDGDGGVRDGDPTHRAVASNDGRSRCSSGDTTSATGVRGSWAGHESLREEDVDDGLENGHVDKES